MDKSSGDSNMDSQRPFTGTDVPVESIDEVLDLRRPKQVPKWVQEAIEAHLEIEREDAKSAGSLGFMHRALVNASMPYKDPKSRIFERKNGNFTLTIMAGYHGGIPYGIYPRLLMSWVSTEVVRTNSPELELGDSLASFLRDVLDLERGGGKRGSSTRVTEQMKRLFGASITATGTGQSNRRFQLRNMSVVSEVDLDEVEFERRLAGSGYEAEPASEGAASADEVQLWTPQASGHHGWKSRVLLTEYFFNELRSSPVPIDLRAYRALRGSPLAMDVYTWLTFRNSYLQRPSGLIRWEVLMNQLGSGYSTPRAVLDFKRNFLQALNAVLIVYPQAKVAVAEKGIILHPSPPHIPKGTQQGLPGF
ncbi:replication protein RepA [Eleftheria terrae]|uniref:replication protein RepA n=1 Tax=Eleftheria terrae TaxID=1597781 RepID=UPI00263B5D06|nr:replication protein RepA [Eleftheria terrae]WKB50534.1 replication protein RepA [Eleftheria terrae]